jgi:hypothetical protein
MSRKFFDFLVQHPFIFALLWPFAVLLFRNGIAIKLTPGLFDWHLPGLWVFAPTFIYCFVPPLAVFWDSPKIFSVDDNRVAAFAIIAVIYLFLMAWPVSFFWWLSYWLQSSLRDTLKAYWAQA